MSLTCRLTPPDARRDLLIGGGMAAAAIVFVMVDCVLYQLSHGGADAGLALRWLMGAVAPWAAAFMFLRLRISVEGGRPSGAEAVLLVGTFAASLLLDAALIPPETLEELGRRAWTRLPLAAFIPLAARLRLAWEAPPRPMARPSEPDRRFAHARVITAAGNYVEVEGACGPRLLRMTFAEAQAALDPGRFLRIHRSTIVAAELVDRLVRDRNGITGVQLIDGRTMRVGPSFRGAVRRAVEG